MRVTEEWRSTHHDKYEVSNLGRIRSWATTQGGKSRSEVPRILSGGTHSFGYPMIVFYPEVQGHLVHRLMLAAFVGPCPAGQEALHKDDNPKNCRLDNLEYGTHLQNVADAVSRGRWTQRKLSMVDIHKIRQVYIDRSDTPSGRVRPGTVSQLVAAFLVSKSTIEKIGRGQRWHGV